MGHGLSIPCNSNLSQTGVDIKIIRTDMLNNKIALMLSLTLLTACASKKTDPEDFKLSVKDRFSTNIKGDGIKLFTYKAQLANLVEPDFPLPHNERIEQVKRKSRAQSGKRYRQPDLSDWTQQIELGLSKTLAMTGYCREGFMELSRIIEVGRAEIRGECNEGATEADKQKFSS